MVLTNHRRLGLVYCYHRLGLVTSTITYVHLRQICQIGSRQNAMLAHARLHVKRPFQIRNTARFMLSYNGIPRRRAQSGSVYQCGCIYILITFLCHATAYISSNVSNGGEGLRTSERMARNIGKCIYFWPNISISNSYTPKCQEGYMNRYFISIPAVHLSAKMDQSVTQCCNSPCGVITSVLFIVALAWNLCNASFCHLLVSCSMQR